MPETPNKNSFLVKHETEGIVRRLTDEQAGQLLKFQYAYSKRNECPPESIDNMVMNAFIVMREYMDMDSAKYQDKCEKRAKAARKRWDEHFRNANDANAFK